MLDLGKLFAQRPRLKFVDDLAQRHRFHHWELAFADLFYGERAQHLEGPHPQSGRLQPGHPDRQPLPPSEAGHGQLSLTARCGEAKNVRS